MFLYDWSIWKAFIVESLGLGAPIMDLQTYLCQPFYLSLNLKAWVLS